jgi:hypothetical protein
METPAAALGALVRMRRRAAGGRVGSPPTGPEADRLRHYSRHLIDQVGELVARAEADPGEWQVMQGPDGDRWLLRVVRLEGEAAEQRGWLQVYWATPLGKLHKHLRLHRK